MKCLAIRVTQPIGEFFVTSLPARILLDVCFTKPHTRYQRSPNGSVRDSWIQRLLNPSRVNSIFDFLQTQEATLPGTLVLAANFLENGQFVGDNDDGELSSNRWCKHVVDENNGLYEIEFPINRKLVAIVDGQHRLWGFNGQTDRVLDMELPCAIFLDMPIPLQAYVFATINFNQKPVSKSQTYELFGYNIDSEEPSAWSPDKLAVFLTRKLNADTNSPLKNHIKIAAIDYSSPERIDDEAAWTVSTATFVSGILSLITNDAQKDRNALNQLPLHKRDRSVLVGCVGGNAVPPLRPYYFENNDALIYTVVRSLFDAVQALFWDSSNYNVFRKTVGVNALFKALRILLPLILERGDVSVLAWVECFSSQNRMVNFDDSFLAGSSGTHVGRIRDMLLMMAGLKNLDDFNGKDCYAEYVRLWNSAKEITHA